MYRDNTLIPSEVVRLLALGILSEGRRPYAQLASEVRHFIGHIAGPSLDLVAPPIQLLTVEGFVESLGASEQADDDDAQILVITAAGSEELHRLLGANMRAPINQLNKLILALKIRFLHLLPAQERTIQLDLLIEMTERELARLSELRARHAEDPGHLVAWLDHDIDTVTRRLAWLQSLAETA